MTTSISMCFNHIQHPWSQNFENIPFRHSTEYGLLQEANPGSLSPLTHLMIAALLLFRARRPPPRAPHPESLHHLLHSLKRRATMRSYHTKRSLLGFVDGLSDQLLLQKGATHGPSRSAMMSSRLLFQYRFWSWPSQLRIGMATSLPRVIGA